MPPTAEGVRLLSGLGLKYAELGPFEDSGPAKTLGVDGSVIAALREALRSYGIRAASMHAPFMGEFDLGDLDARKREKTIELHLRQLRYCSELEVRYYVVHPGGLIYAGWDDQRKLGIWSHDHSFAEKLWKINAEVVSRLARTGKDLGVAVCLENGWLNDPSFMTREDFMGIIEGANSDNVGACIDTGHANIGSAVRPSDVLRRMGSSVWAVHISDNDGSGDFHLPPGRGNIDWPDVVSALAEISYAGTLNLETDPVEGVPFLRRLLGEPSS